MVPPVASWLLGLSLGLRGLRADLRTALRRLLGLRGRRVLEAARRRTLGQAQVDVRGPRRAAIGEHLGGRRPLRRAGDRRRRSTGRGRRRSGAVEASRPGVDAADLGAQLGRRGRQQRHDAQRALVRDGRHRAVERPGPPPAGRWSSCRAAGCRRRRRARDRSPTPAPRRRRARGRRCAGRGGSRHGRRPPMIDGYGSTAVRSWSGRTCSVVMSRAAPSRAARTRGASVPLSPVTLTSSTATSPESRSHSQPPPRSARTHAQAATARSGGRRRGRRRGSDNAGRGIRVRPSTRPRGSLP